MPTHEYRCGACGHEFEIEQRITADRLTDCPACKQPKLERLISASSFTLKGGGWYRDGWRQSRGAADRGADERSPHHGARDDKKKEAEKATETGASQEHRGRRAQQPSADQPAATSSTTTSSTTTSSSWFPSFTQKITSPPGDLPVAGGEVQPSPRSRHGRLGMKIRPLHDRIVIKRKNEEERTAGGFHPETAKERPTQSHRRGGGQGRYRRNTSADALSRSRWSDTVLFGKYAGPRSSWMARSTDHPRRRHPGRARQAKVRDLSRFP